MDSIVAITDSSQATVQRYDYDTFGHLTESDDFVNSYAFTGWEWDDELGLYYYRARYYDSQTGRFISKDPIGFAGEDINVYRYVWNNAPRLIDPQGYMGFDFGFDEGDIYLNELRIYQSNVEEISRFKAQIGLCRKLEEDNMRFRKLLDFLYAIPPIDMNGTVPVIFGLFSDFHYEVLEKSRNNSIDGLNSSLEKTNKFNNFFD